MIIKGKKITITWLIVIIISSVILLLATVLGSYMFIRSRGQLKNNSLSTKLQAYDIENDFWEFSDKFDKEFDNILFCGVDHFNNTDVIMVISVNKKLHKINILRIPRDVYIGDNYATGKINSVYSHPKRKLTGADTLAYELNNIFRIKIDKYIFMTLDIFEDMIDDIGGLNITLKKDVPIDADNIIKAGKVHLNGKLASDFVRHRKSYLTADIGRIHAQNQVVKQIGKKLINEQYIKNIPFLNKYYNLIETNIGRKEVNKYTSAFKDIDVDKIQTFVIDGVPIKHNGYSVYLANVKKTTDLLNMHFMPEGLALKPANLKLPTTLKPDDIQQNISTSSGDIDNIDDLQEYDDFQNSESLKDDNFFDDEDDVNNQNYSEENEEPEEDDNLELETDDFE